MNEKPTGAAASQPSPGDLKALRIIADTHSALLQSNDLGEIYQLVGQKIYELVGDGYVVMSQMEESTQSMRVVAQFGLGNLAQKAIQILGQDPRQSVFYLKDRTEEELKSFRSGKLERMEGGLYAMLTRRLPKAACTAVEKLLQVKGVYAMGLVWHGLHFGDLTLMAKRDIAPYREMIEIIMNQAALTMDRLRVEAALRESEERFHSLFENSTIGLYRTTPDGRILLANSELCRMLGFPSFEELARRNLEEGDLPTEYSRQAFRQKIEEKGEIRGLESAWERKDGTSIFVRESARVVRDAKGRILYYEGTVEDITERKQSEEALRTAEANYRNLFERVPSGLYRSTPEGRFLEVNPALADLFGYSSVQELMTLDIGSAFYRSAQERRQWVEKLLQVGELRNTEYQALRKDGSFMVLLENSRVVRDESGKVLFIEGTLTDTTDRKRAEEDLRQSEEDFRNLFERAPVGFYRTTPDGQILMANPALIQMVGAHSFQELTSSNLETGELEPVEQRTEFKRLIETEGEVTGLEGIWLKADGTPIHVRESARAVRDEAGKTLYYEGTAEDITEHIRAQTSLQESERRFREALENIHLVAVNLDKEGRVTFCNDYFLQLTGFRREGVLEHDYFALCIPTEIQVELRAVLQGALEREELPIHNTNEILARTGERRLVAWTNTLMRDNDGRPMGVNYLGEDITEQKLLEQKAEKARMDFLYAVSHELKTPLFLMATAQEMLKSLPEQDKLKRFAEQEELWVRNLLRLRLLINNLVDSQRTQTTGMRLSFVPSDLAALTKLALTDMQILAAKKSLLLVADLASLPLLPLDPEAIERVLHNLLTNAIKFSSPEGEVTVRLRQEEDRAALVVQDHGVGIPADVLPDLFQPFRRAPGAVRSVVPGTGLGLYVTKILVEAHGGTISLESEVGQGTTVIVHLPLSTST
jgi:PAS domain S-box-containing protein